MHSKADYTFTAEVSVATVIMRGAILLGQCRQWSVRTSNSFFCWSLPPATARTQPARMMLVKCWLFLARCCRNLLDQDTSLCFFKVSILSKVLLRDSEISDSFFSEAMQVSRSGYSPVST